MPSTQYRDAWILGKELKSEGLARLKTTLAQNIDVALRFAIDARRSLDAANDLTAAYNAIDTLAIASRRLSTVSHSAKLHCDWAIPPVPEFQDQFVNQHFLLPEHKRTFWLEGAVFCGLGIKPGRRILELCCGMGWYTDFFYSPFASEIIAVDFDPRAIEMAQRFHQQPNIKFEVMDIREKFPAGPFDTVIWDGAIEHFTEKEIDGVMKNLKAVMTADACLVGYTVAEAADAPQLPTHETHFSGIEHLGGILKRFFKNTRVFERIHPTLTPPRHNLFFYASDGVLPFDREWEHGVRV
jgi:SAM-dependent methyltransferase